MDFEVQRCTRRCASSQRELAAGEPFYSVLRAEAAATGPAVVVRYDYAEDAWNGPPQDCVGWWKSRMPAKEEQKGKLAPNDVLLRLFQQLEDQADKDDMRYVLALLLVRRRVLQLEDEKRDEVDDASEEDVMSLYCPRDESTYRVRAATPDDDRVEEIQNELTRLLFADTSPEDSA